MKVGWITFEVKFDNNSNLVPGNLGCYIDSPQKRPCAKSLQDVVKLRVIILNELNHAFGYANVTAENSKTMAILLYFWDRHYNKNEPLIIVKNNNNRGKKILPLKQTYALLRDIVAKLTGFAKQDVSLAVKQFKQQLRLRITENSAIRYNYSFIHKFFKPQGQFFWQKELSLLLLENKKDQIHLLHILAEEEFTLLNELKGLEFIADNQEKPCQLNQSPNINKIITLQDYAKRILLYAIYSNQDILDIYLKIYQAKINMSLNDSGVTVLHYAVLASEESSLVKQLICFGADPNIKDKSNFSPFDLAVLFDKREIIKLLLPKVTSFNQPLSTFTKFTPLLIAVLNGDEENIASLLKLGASPTFSAEKCGISLSLIAKMRKVETAITLLGGSKVISKEEENFLFILHQQYFELSKVCGQQYSRKIINELTA